MTLGELLQGMGPGQTAGYPQMAPPPGIPWQQPVQAAPPQPAPPVPQPTQPNTLRQPGQGSAPAVPEALYALKNLIDSTLGENRSKWEEQDRTAYEDARGKEAVGGGLNIPPEVSEPHTLKRPGAGSMPSMPSFGGGMSGEARADPAGDFNAFGNYTGAGLTSPLAAALYPDTEVPLPEKGMRSAPAVPASAATPSRQKDGGGSTPSRTGAASPATAPRSNTSPTGPSSASSRRSSFQEAPYGEGFDPYRGRENTGKNDMARFFLQAGLSLMVPQWGGPVAQIGKAIGEGAEAVGRGSEIETKDRVTQQKMDLDAERVRKIGIGRKGASESSSSKKLKKLTPQQQMAENLSPEASLYFGQRMKDLNKTGEADVDEKGNSISSAQKYEKILAETKAMDQKVRAARGQARADEIGDDVLNRVAGTPQESLALSAVAADPVQRALMQKRLEEIKVKKAGANAAK